MTNLHDDRRTYKKISFILRNNPEARSEVVPAMESMFASLDRDEYSEVMEIIGTIMYCLPLNFDAAVELFAQTTIHSYLMGNGNTQ